MSSLRHSVRALRRTPAFTVGALLTVALSVGATTAIYSVVYAVLLRQLPYRDADTLAWIWSDTPGRDRSPFNVPDFIDYRDSTRALTGLAGFFAYSGNLNDGDTPERVQGIRATGNLFDVLGLQPRAGRLLQPGDEAGSGDRVVVLSEGLWQRRFGGDASAIGRSLRLNGEAYTIVGVLPREFVMPSGDVDVVLPFSPDRDPRHAARNSVNFIQTVGRFGGTAEQALAELNAIARRLQERFPEANARKRGVKMVAAMDGVSGSFRTALLTLLAAAATVLLIACGNVANLMLIRANGRRREVAVRIALGAAPSHVLGLVLLEALLIAIVGGAAGAALARAGVSALVAAAPAQLPRAGEIRVDGAVLAFSLFVSSITGLLFGVVPAIASSRVDAHDALHASGRSVTAGRQRVRGLLVGAQVTLAAALLVVMTLLAKSFANVEGVAPGFDAAHTLSARLTLPVSAFHTRDAIVAFQQAVAGRLAALPGVTGTGAISILPMSGPLARVPFTVEGRPIPRERVPYAQFRTVTPGYIEAMGIPLVRGRTFTDADNDRTRDVALVSDELARHWIGPSDPIGSRLLVNDNDTGPRPVEIVGVVGNVRQASLDAAATPDLYLTYSQMHRDNVGALAASMFWVVRVTGDPMRLAQRVAADVRRVNADVVAANIRPVARYISDAVAPRRFSVSLMAAFTLAALALAVVGLYAIVLHAASQRSREIAIRVALGASPGSVVRTVAGEGLTFAASGLAAGVALAAVIARLLSSTLFGLSPFDAATFVQTIAAVAVAAFGACVLPARRAVKGSVLSTLSRVNG